jgi:hypothetical protein
MNTIVIISARFGLTFRLCTRFVVRYIIFLRGGIWQPGHTTIFNIAMTNILLGAGTHGYHTGQYDR